MQTQIKFIDGREHHSCDCCGKLTWVHELCHVVDGRGRRIERDCEECYPDRQDWVLEKGSSSFDMAFAFS